MEMYYYKRSQDSKFETEVKLCRIAKVTCSHDDEDKHLDQMSNYQVSHEENYYVLR